MLGETDPEKIADLLNVHFTEIGSKLASKIDCGNPRIIPDIMNYGLEFSFEMVGTKDVDDMLNSIVSSKATGLDGLNARLLKDPHHEIAVPISHILNQSLRMSKFPDSWKNAKVTPLFKDGDCSKPENYRPISVLPVLGKILERIVHNQLYAFLSDHNLLHQAQSGFRKSHSTITCALKVVDDIFASFDKGLHVGMIFLDLKKAFDTVDHAILCQKLVKYGMTHGVVKWFHSYLHDRTQCTVFEGHISSPRKVTCGVPQGSILGPLLFILYLNDLPSVLMNSTITMYADDTAIYYESNDMSELEVMLQEDMNLIYNWLCVNKLSLNVAKSKSMVFSLRTHDSNSLNITVCGQVLEEVTQYKYLGIFLDKKLNFDFHIESICSGAKKKLALLGRTRKFVTKESSLLLYKTLLLPVLDYGDVLYGTASIASLAKVQRIQNSACRIVLFADKRTHIVDLHRELNLLELHMRRKFHLDTLVFKCMHNLAPRYLCNLLESLNQITDVQTRALTQGNLKVPRTRTKTAEKSFSVRGPASWNSLSLILKECESLYSFKTAYWSTLIDTNV